VDEGHDPHAALALGQDRAGARVLAPPGLQIEEAGDDLQVVLDPVVDLFQQGLFLAEGGGQSLRRAKQLREDGYLGF